MVTDQKTDFCLASVHLTPSEPLGGVRNLQVLNPTMTTLNVRWEPAEGRVKEYKVNYVPAAGGAESMVGLVGKPSASCRPCLSPVCPSTSVILNSECLDFSQQLTVHQQFTQK